MHIAQNGPFCPGYTAITTEGEPTANTMMDFGILTLGANEHYRCDMAKERAFLLMKGDVVLTYEEHQVDAQRQSLFDESPICLHVPEGIEVTIQSRGETEIAIVRTVNPKAFTPVFYGPGVTRSERRGKGTMQETSTRIVRTVFDKTNAPDSNLVLGEVITFPGKWSSYPPHYHPQPEIYHYRFLPKGGFGACFLGDHIVKVTDGSTTKILDNNVHPQTAAPGYAMYYLWAIRHLEGAPYITPVFTDEHTWVMDQDAVIYPEGGRE